MTGRPYLEIRFGRQVTSSIKLSRYAVMSKQQLRQLTSHYVSQTGSTDNNVADKVGRR